MGALPEELGASIAAAHAHVGIQIEDGVPGQLAVAIHQRRFMTELTERAPDRLVNAQGMRVLHEGGKQEVERLVRSSACRQVARQRQSGAPVLWVVVDQLPAETRETFR